MAISLKSGLLSKGLAVLFALALAFVSVEAIANLGPIHTHIAEAAGSGAFDKVEVGNSKVSGSTNVDSGIFKDMNFLLTVFIGIAGIIVIMCIVFAGIKLATAQNNPQNRTQGFIGLGMALLGGWVIYKALDLAGWIQGFGS